MSLVSAESAKITMDMAFNTLNQVISETKDPGVTLGLDYGYEHGYRIASIHPEEDLTVIATLARDSVPKNGLIESVQQIDEFALGAMMGAYKRKIEEANAKNGVEV